MSICSWLCNTCEFLLEWTAATLPKNLTLSAFEADLNALCLKLGSVSKECDLVVALYGKDLFDDVTGVTPANVTCGHLHLCSAATSAFDARISYLGATTPSSQLACSMCRMTMFGIEQRLIEAPVDVNALAGELQLMCRQMTGASSAACDVMVHGMMRSLATTSDFTASACSSAGICA